MSMRFYFAGPTLTMVAMCASIPSSMPECDIVAVVVLAHEKATSFDNIDESKTVTLTVVPARR
jgi:hypothetical protein